MMELVMHDIFTNTTYKRLITDISLLQVTYHNVFLDGEKVASLITDSEDDDWNLWTTPDDFHFTDWWIRNGE